MRKQYNPIRIVAVGVALLLGTGACNLLGDESPCSGAMFSALRPVLPPSATDIHESCAGGVNPTDTADFRMFAQDLALFQQHTRIQTWQSNGQAAVAFKSEAAQAQSLLFGSFGDGAIRQEILIDTSDPQRYKVYYSTSDID